MKDAWSVFLPYLAIGLLIVCHYGTLSYKVHRLQGACVFGDAPDCFFQCHCKMKQCFEGETNCQNCEPLTGACFGDDRDSCEKQHYQNVGNVKENVNPYLESYWKGPACQIGNLARNQASEFEIGSPSYDVIHPLTDGIFEHGTNLTFTQVEYWLVSLQDISKVQFVDFQVKLNPGAREFNDNLDVSLEIRRKNGSVVTSATCNHVAGNNLLSADFPKRKLKQIHYTCSSPSVGNMVKIQSKAGIKFSFSVRISEVIVIGNKHIENNFLHDGSCIEASKQSSILRWCLKCQDSLPPDCSIPCSEGKSGINCVNDDSEETFFTIPNIIVIAVFGIILTIIGFGLLVWYKCSSNIVPSNEAVPKKDLEIIPPPPPMRDNEDNNAYCELDEVASTSETPPAVTEPQQLAHPTDQSIRFSYMTPANLTIDSSYITVIQEKDQVTKLNGGTTSEKNEPAFKEAQQLANPTAQSIRSSYITPASLIQESEKVTKPAEEEKQRSGLLNIGLGFHVPLQPKPKSDGISGDENNIDSPRKDDGIADNEYSYAILGNRGYHSPRSEKIDGVNSDVVAHRRDDDNSDDGFLHPITETSDRLKPINQRKEGKYEPLLNYNKPQISEYTETI